MAGVVKWLRPRIVVPLCVGSNPISRPIKKTVTFVTVFFILSVDIDSEKSEQAKKTLLVTKREGNTRSHPDTVVKTHCGKNSWRATSWEDN